MHRKKPSSAKQRKEQLQLKRAVKRGDVPAPPPAKPDRHRKARRGPTGLPVGSATRSAAAESTRRLESSFVKLPPVFLETTRALASALPLTRPIPSDRAILPDVDKPLPGAPSPSHAPLTCPRRPKWRYDMSKKEVEANEQGLFKKWLAQTDAAVDAWCHHTTDVSQPSSSSTAAAQDQAQSSQTIQDTAVIPRAPTSFERNLEVWRQLWRVTEISQILLILLDSRCPTLHFSPALAAYLSGISNASRVRTILVLTKVDISGPDRAAAWTNHLNALYPGVRVVQVESYTERYPEGDASNAKKRLYEPHLPSAFRQTLVEALRETHAELVEPPPAVKNDPDKLAAWKPRIRPDVDWDAVLKAQGGQVGTAVGGAAAPKPSTKAPSDDNVPEERTEEENAEAEVLTIGLIGQPNVGKSSLLNALFGTQKVRASRTPGKTKHFQTLFWTPEVRLVDCPGLVIPNYVPMEMQVLSGILPISRVSAVPICIYHAAQLLPLEKILALAHPSLLSPPAEDKRTWREGMRPRDAPGGPNALVWTAMDILTAYANKKGWMTAKAGRPDVNRAGNAILRALAEGKIRWAFWPPGTDPRTIEAHQKGPDGESTGIWIAHEHEDHDQLDTDTEPDGTDGDNDERGALSDIDDDDHDDDDEDDDDDDDANGGGGARSIRQNVSGATTTGRFGALLVLDDPDGEPAQGGGPGPKSTDDDDDGDGDDD